jgi:hypothetical protein
LGWSDQESHGSKGLESFLNGKPRLNFMLSSTVFHRSSTGTKPGDVEIALHAVTIGWYTFDFDESALGLKVPSLGPVVARNFKPTCIWRWPQCVYICFYFYFFVLV